MSGDSDGFVLSGEALSVWAKSDRRGGGWLQLVQHMNDTAFMAGHLYDTWLATSVKRLWGDVFPGGETQARAIFVFLAAGHDVGKSAPVFVAQVETLAKRSRALGLPCAVMEELRTDRKLLPHATVSYLTMLDWLQEQGVAKPVAKQLASVVGAHHGKPAAGRLADLRDRKDALGGSGWASIRRELLDWQAAQLGLETHLATLDEDTLIPLPVLVTMCGLLIMADWMASNQDFFPLRPLDDDLSPQMPGPDALAERGDWGWGESGLPHSWAPDEPDESIDELYDSRFDWRGDKTPRPLQREAVELVRRNPVGLVIVEAEMGGGKTETALVMSEILAAQVGSHGVFVALPTQATTDAMFSRVVKWIDRLPQPMADVPAWAMTLAHGKASLNPEYAANVKAFNEFEWEAPDPVPFAEVMDEEGGQDESDGCYAAAVAHDWFGGRKRRLLANFGVGTIDQVLMAGLQQKHLMVRHLALAGKVVVIDECHASDSYMNVYLDRVLSWLGHFGVPVVLLSATLTQERKQQMIHAYAPDVETVPEATGYPCLTWVNRDRDTCEAVTVDGPQTPREVTWSWLDNDDDTMVQALREELVDGGCALVVRNTVKDAQRLADRLREANVAPVVTLTHSRFLAADRALNDQRLLQNYGPQSGLGSRPTKAIVVATQVVEQSLDVDFDVLFTDLAPMDLLFQRIGRLHRHDWRNRPQHLREARVHVIVEREDGGVITGSNGSRFVYGDHHLLRTAWVLGENARALVVPDDIAPWVQRALGATDLDVTDAAWSQAMAMARERFDDEERKRRHKASMMALDPFDPYQDDEKSLFGNGWMGLAGDFSELAMQATVRDTKPTVEVVVACVDPEGNVAMSPPWMDNPVTIDISTIPDDDTARRIASWTVKLPMWLSGHDPLPLVDELMNQTKRWKWQRHPLLKNQPILVMRQTHEGSHVVQATITGPRGSEVVLRYDPARGLEEVRDDVQLD